MPKVANRQQSVASEEEHSAFLQRHPKRNREWERSEKKLAVVLIPKFGQHLFGRWMLTRMQRPNYRLSLDEVGSFVWERCDGAHSVEDIGRDLAEQFGQSVEPVFERLGLFFQQLERTKSIIWD